MWGKKKDTGCVFTRPSSIAVETVNYKTNMLVPCAMSKQLGERRKGSCYFLFFVCVCHGAGVLDEPSHSWYLGCTLKEWTQFHQVPSLSSHLITRFFLFLFLNGLHLLYFFPCNLFTIQHPAFHFPFPYSTKTVSGKSPQRTNWPVAKSCDLSQPSSSFASLQELAQWTNLSLISPPPGCRDTVLSCLAAPSQVLLNSAVPRDTLLSIHAPVLLIHSDQSWQLPCLQLSSIH